MPLQNSEAQGAGSTTLWIFGYGSLIWRPDFAFVESRRARVANVTRRFWQASHDHRGTPDAPGRVVTLVPSTGAWCEGRAFRLAAGDTGPILTELDRREQDGYERSWLMADLDDDRQVECLSWIAHHGNPSWLGDIARERLLQQLNQRVGPSGSNREYVLRLAEGLKSMGICDADVESLARDLRAMPG